MLVLAGMIYKQHNRFNLIQILMHRNLLNSHPENSRQPMCLLEELNSFPLRQFVFLFLNNHGFLLTFVQGNISLWQLLGSYFNLYYLRWFTMISRSMNYPQESLPSYCDVYFETMLYVLTVSNIHFWVLLPNEVYHLMIGNSLAIILTNQKCH